MNIYCDYWEWENENELYWPGMSTHNKNNNIQIYKIGYMYKKNQKHNT